MTWIVMTVIFLLLFIYRGLIGRKEEDQIFLSGGDKRFMDEQQKIIHKLKRISPFLMTTGLLSILLFIGVVTLWVYRGLKIVNM
jgi:hypothetical protein